MGTSLLITVKQFVGDFKSGDLITYFALVIAYLAYALSVDRDLKSWRSLFLSFQSDLGAQKSWLVREYFADNYTDKNSYSPEKIIYPLSFESLPEIIRRGPVELDWIPDKEKFIRNLSIFNERILAFNSILIQMSAVSSANPVNTEKVINKLNDLGIRNDDVTFEELKKSIDREISTKNNDVEIGDDKENPTDYMYIANNLRRLNRIVHVKLISNDSEEDKLHFLYTEICKRLENILAQFETRKPWYIKFRAQLIIISFACFWLIEKLCK